MNIQSSSTMMEVFVFVFFKNLNPTTRLPVKHSLKFSHSKQPITSQHPQTDQTSCVPEGGAMLVFPLTAA